MNHTFTPEDLIRFYYGETTPTENEQIEKELKSSSVLKIEFDQIQQTLAQFDKSEVEPSESSILIIMEYAKAQHPELQ